MIACMAIMALATTGATEPMEASFCDFWPLAVGNSWVVMPVQGDLGLTVEVLSQNTHNGYITWCMELTEETFVGSTIDYVYWVFVGGWLYQTSNEADLQSLPAIGGGLRRVCPEIFRNGESFTMEGFFWGDYTVSYVVTPVVTSDSIALYASIQGETACFLILIRGKGVSLPPPYAPADAHIVGTCSGPFQVQISAASLWVKFGGAIQLLVPASSGPGYQWCKDGATIDGASANTYLKVPATLDDSGSYTCRIWDGAQGFHETKAVQVTVFPQGALPVAGLVGLGILAAMLTALGRARIRKAQRN